MEATSIDSPHTRQGVWQSISSYKIGPLPLPIYVAIAAITIIAALNKKLPNDIIGGFAVLMLAGFLLGEIGNRLPVFKHIGGGVMIVCATLLLKLFN